MAHLRLQTPLSLQLYDHYTYNPKSSATRKLLHHNINNHGLYTTKPHPIFCSVRNSVALQQFNEYPSQKSINKHGLSRNEQVFDVSSCGELVRECTDTGLFEDAIGVYVDLLTRGFPVEEFRFFPCLIKAFGGLCDVHSSKWIHGHVLKVGFGDDLYVANALLSMYWKCGAGAIEDAIKMFEKMTLRDTVSWNSMISGYCQSGDFTASLNIFSKMAKDYSLYPNRVACLSALSSCASIESLIKGKEIHGFIVKCGLDVDEFLVSALIEMYMKCASIRNAELVFKSILDRESVRRNVVIWNVMILGYVCNGCLSTALELFVEMLELGIKPDSSTMVGVLILFSRLLDLEIGKQIHGFIFKSGLETDVRVFTALMEMYFKCGDPESGLKMFRWSQNHNLVAWGAIISNCAQNGYATKVLEFFHEFMSEHGGFPDSVLLVGVLRACSSLAAKPKGMEIHGLAVKMGFDSNAYVGGALVDMYGKCRAMESAEKVFRRLPSWDLVSYNALMSGFAQNEQADEALNLFRDMQSNQIRPNTVTAACILSVCAHLSLLSSCKEVHCYLLSHGFAMTSLVSNSLLAAYAKCGDMRSSWTIFEQMPERDEVSWNSIIFGLGMHGHTNQMFDLFEKMKEAGMKPDHATFTALLSGCSHAGKVDMGWKYFKSMGEDYKLEPQLEHYTCMVDLLGRAGHLNQAYDLIMTMPYAPDDCIWGSLLGSCRSYGNEKLAEHVASQIYKLQPSSIGYRVLLANVYEDFGKLNEVDRVRSEIKDLGLKKQPGCSWIEVNNDIDVFVASDRSHPQSEEIYTALGNLTIEIKRAGYVPQLSTVSVGPDEVNSKGLNVNKDTDFS